MKSKKAVLVQWLMRARTFHQWGHGFHSLCHNLGPVSQKSRNCSGLFRVPKFPIYLRDAKVLSHQTSQCSWFFWHVKHAKRSALPNKWIAVWQLAFRARKVLGTFEKQAPGLNREGIFWNELMLSDQRSTLESSFFQYVYGGNSALINSFQWNAIFILHSRRRITIS